jgi:trehalose 6-phosphate synthase/phosphatase
MTDRVILVSNRLPVSIRRSSRGPEVTPSSGGLATGLRGLHEGGNGTWIGWPGLSDLTPEERAFVDERLAALHLVPVHLPRRTSKRFYDRVCNGVIWPLFHYLLDRLPDVVYDFSEYETANQYFADVVCEHARGDELIWVHDYQLMLLPSMLRKRLPDARIGFFLHVPFPSSEVFRVLPHREAVLTGLLGADLIGFHTHDYQRHFSDSLLSVLGLETEVDHVEVEGHSVQLGVFPMGIDAQGFDALSRRPETLEECDAFRSVQAVDKLLLGVDRLDYTKGLPRRLLAFERLLERSPEHRGKVRFVQIAIPSREDVDEYRNLRREMDELTGRINGIYSTLRTAPIHYVHGSVVPVELGAIYRAADVMLVTPLRDGMNLVAKEYVASRSDGDGVLVLSEFAGAASELSDALIVNPYDVEALATTFDRALRMPETERRERMARLRESVFSRPIEMWSDSFVSALRSVQADQRPVDLRSRSDELRKLADGIAFDREVLFALDYDGTLMGIRQNPEDAGPDAELVALLAQLASQSGVKVAVVSGRTRESLEEWLGALPISLIAEHGVWTRLAGSDWICHVDAVSTSWMEPLKKKLDEYASRTPGARVEEKTAGLAWHYRAAAHQLGALRARELRLNLIPLLSRAPVSVMSGRKVVEIRPQGIDKGTAVQFLLGKELGNMTVVAAGDDRTDEDLFAALPPSALTLCAGPAPTRAKYRLAGPEQVRSFLRRFIARRTGSATLRSNPAPSLPLSSRPIT